VEPETDVSLTLEITDIRQQRQMPSTLDSGGKLPLMFCASTAGAAGDNFTPLGDKAAEHFEILKIDSLDLAFAEMACFPATAIHRPEPSHQSFSW
jgi:hypothetical protein